MVLGHHQRGPCPGRGQQAAPQTSELKPELFPRLPEKGSRQSQASHLLGASEHEVAQRKAGGVCQSPGAARRRTTDLWLKLQALTTLALERDACGGGVATQEPLLQALSLLVDGSHVLSACASACAQASPFSMTPVPVKRGPS